MKAKHNPDKQPFSKTFKEIEMTNLSRIVQVSKQKIKT